MYIYLHFMFQSFHFGNFDCVSNSIRNSYSKSSLSYHTLRMSYIFSCWGKYNKKFHNAMKKKVFSFSISIKNKYIINMRFEKRHHIHFNRSFWIFANQELITVKGNISSGLVVEHTVNTLSLRGFFWHSSQFHKIITIIHLRYFSNVFGSNSRDFWIWNNYRNIHCRRLELKKIIDFLAHSTTLCGLYFAKNFVLKAWQIKSNQLKLR